jgi:hypothetical protein
MADIRLLERTLAQNVAWNRARINFVAKFLVALIQVRSVNLAEVAGVFAGGASSRSSSSSLRTRTAVPSPSPSTSSRSAPGGGAW